MAGTPGSGASARTTAAGSGGTGHSGSMVSVTRSPDRIAVPTAARSLPGSTVNPMSAPNSSSATDPAASDAVVMTAVAPRMAATCRASTLAPPACPPRIGTANCSASSTHTTPGSVYLPASSGAAIRTVAPTARKQTIRSHSSNACGSAAVAGPR